MHLARVQLKGLFCASGALDETDSQYRHWRKQIMRTAEFRTTRAELSFNEACSKQRGQTKRDGSSHGQTYEGPGRFLDWSCSSPRVAQLCGSSSELYGTFSVSCRRLCPRWCRRWRWSFEPTLGRLCLRASSSRTLRRKR